MDMDKHRHTHLGDGKILNLDDFHRPLDIIKWQQAFGIIDQKQLANKEHKTPSIVLFFVNHFLFFFKFYIYTCVSVHHSSSHAVGFP